MEVEEWPSSSETTLAPDAMRLDAEEALDNDLRTMEAEMRNEFLLLTQEVDPWDDILEEVDATSISEPQQGSRIRTHFDGAKRAILERFFNEVPKPSPEQVSELATVCCITEKSVKTWFANKRAIRRPPQGRRK